MPEALAELEPVPGKLSGLALTPGAAGGDGCGCGGGGGGSCATPTRSPLAAKLLGVVADTLAYSAQAAAAGLQRSSVKANA